MERLPDHKILEFHPDTLQHVRKELGLDGPGQMDAAIDLLDDWVKKQAHFTKKDFSRDYLERTIVFDKGSIERAKVQMDRLFTMKTSMPFFFERVDAKNDYEDVHDHYVDALLPKLTKDHCRIYAAKVINGNDMKSSYFSLCYAFGTLILENIKSNDYSCGFIGIIDYRNTNILDIVGHLNIMEAHQFFSLIMEGYQLRVKAIHILTTSKSIEVLVRILKQVFSKKIADRIRVHMDMESLYQYLPPDVLPKEYGGDLKSLVEYNEEWCELLGTKENMAILREMNKAGVNENLRNGASRCNSEIMGISGSFKTLNVD